MVSMEQLLTCNNTNQSLSKSSTPNNYKNIYNGVRSYSWMKLGLKLNKTLTLWNIRDLNLQTRILKNSTCRNIVYQTSVLPLKKSTHTGEKTYNCEYSDISNQSSNLTQQQNIQDPQKSYKCKKCEKAFTNSSSLSRHKKILSVWKPFKGTECGNASNQNSKLSQDWQIHTGKKPYECKECGKPFMSCSNLSQHQRIHTGGGGKHYKCTQCGKAFKSELKAYTTPENSYWREAL